MLNPTGNFKYKVSIYARLPSQQQEKCQVSTVGSELTNKKTYLHLVLTTNYTE